MASSSFKARFQNKLFIVPKGGLLKITENHKVPKNCLLESKCFSYQRDLGAIYESTSPIKKTKSLSSISSDLSEIFQVSSVPYPLKPNRNVNRIRLDPIVQDFSKSSSKIHLESCFNPRRKSDTKKSLKLEVLPESPFKGFRRKLSYSDVQSAKVENFKPIKASNLIPNQY
jgi:hypothetical protein